MIGASYNFRSFFVTLYTKNLQKQTTFEAANMKLNCLREAEKLDAFEYCISEVYIHNELTSLRINAKKSFLYQ